MSRPPHTHPHHRRVSGQITELHPTNGPDCTPKIPQVDFDAPRPTKPTNRFNNPSCGRSQRQREHRNWNPFPFKSAPRFAVVSDPRGDPPPKSVKLRVSIRFGVRGGFRRATWTNYSPRMRFQSALRFAVVSDLTQLGPHRRRGFNPL